MSKEEERGDFRLTDHNCPNTRKKKIMVMGKRERAKREEAERYFGALLMTQLQPLWPLRLLFSMQKSLYLV